MSQQDIDLEGGRTLLVTMTARVRDGSTQRNKGGYDVEEAWCLIVNEKFICLLFAVARVTGSEMLL